jgi:predicted dehydrogenase
MIGYTTNRDTISDVRAYSVRESALTVPVFDDTDPYERQVEAFARAVRGQQPANPNVVDGLEAVRLIEAVAESAATGEEVRL